MIGNALSAMKKAQRLWQLLARELTWSRSSERTSRKVITAPGEERWDINTGKRRGKRVRRSGNSMRSASVLGGSAALSRNREKPGVWREKRWGWTTCRPRGEGSWSPPRAIKEMLKAEFDITRLNLVGCWAFWVAKGEECFNPQRNFYQISWH